MRMNMPPPSVTSVRQAERYAMKKPCNIFNAEKSDGFIVEWKRAFNFFQIYSMSGKMRVIFSRSAVRLCEVSSMSPTLFWCR